jgi:3-phosphoshikimate 1-carboxyvinyltransferase
MSPLTDELIRHGAVIETHADGILVSGMITPGEFVLPGGVSSHFVSGMLMALPLIGPAGSLIVTGTLASRPYIDLTLEIMRCFGIPMIESVRLRDGCECAAFALGGPLGKVVPEICEIEGDWSGAAYFLCAAALGCDVRVSGLRDDSVQGDRRIIEILRTVTKGCFAHHGAEGGSPHQGDGTSASEACATLKRCTPTPLGEDSLPRHLTSCCFDMSDVPDLVPPVAALLCLSPGRWRLSGVSRLRDKESDRLQSVTEGLRALGAEIWASGDEIIIDGKEWLDGGRVDSHGDHRIAMMAALAAVGCRGDVYVSDPDCVSKSYPDFWKDWECTSLPSGSLCQS